MPALAQKSKVAQQTPTKKTAETNHVESEPVQGENLVIYLQRTIGNRAVQRLLETGAGIPQTVFLAPAICIQRTAENPDLQDLHDAENAFDAAHQSLVHQYLSDRQLLRIHSALRAVLQRGRERNLNLWIAFLDYYSGFIGHHIRLADADELARNHWQSNEEARTGDILHRMTLRFDFDTRPATSDPRTLGSILIHEFTHEESHPSPGPSGRYQEGENYGIEWFFSERTGNAERMRTVHHFYQDPGGQVGVLDRDVASFRHLFEWTYGTLVCLYDVVDNGRSSYTDVSPALANLRRESANQLITQLVQNGSGGRGVQGIPPGDLRNIYEAVSRNPARFPINAPAA